MSDAAVLIPRLDSLPVAAGVPAPQPAGKAPAGSFAGVLSQRMQDAQAPDSPPAAPSPAALAEENSGDASPQTGKPLPQAVADTGSDGDAAFLNGLPLPLLSPPDVTEGGLPVSAPPAPLLAGPAPLSATAPLDGTSPADTLQAAPDSALAIATTGTKPLPEAALTAPPTAPLPASPPPAMATNTAAAAPEEAAGLTPPSPLETQSASVESRPPDWLAMRMAKARGLDPRPATPQASSLNKPDGHTPTKGGQDFLQMLGIRPASATAGAMAAGADGVRPLMPLLPERFPGEGSTAAVPAASGTPDSAAAGMLSGVTQAPAISSTSMLPTVSVATPVGQGAWSQDMGQRVTWLANQDIREAQIQLNPRHLGPVEVRISYGQEQQLSVSFVAHHPQAREALDAMLPRLRDMFDGQGLNLANVSVSQESFTERRRDFASNPNASNGYTGGGGDVLDETDGPPLKSLATGLIDAYA